MSADRDLFLHEFIDINGMQQWDYMEHTLQQSGDEKVEFELLGTWYTMGITARWPQVVNVWEIPGGWDGWFGKVDRLGLKRCEQRDPQRVVEAGVRVPVGWVRPAARRGHRGARTSNRCTRDDVHGLAVRPRGHRGAPRHRARVSGRGARGARAAARRVRASTRRPLRGDDERLRGVHDLGHHADAHVRAAKARDVARGLATERSSTAGDPRFEEWHARARTWAVHWREELMTPHVGTLCAPAEAPLDDSVA